MGSIAAVNRISGKQRRAESGGPALTGWFVPSQVFDGWNVTDNTAVHVVCGIIEGVCPLSEVPADTKLQGVGGLLAPGFFDAQVNGGGDVLFNQVPSETGLKRIAAAHRQFGTVALLPTVITDTPEVLQMAVDATLSSTGRHGIAGIHIEGPHIAKRRKGVHAAEHIRPMQTGTLNLVRSLRARKIPVMITVAPESTTTAQIAELARTGTVVSIGHSEADADCVRAALGAGATAFTHLFNGMPPMRSRAPGVVGAAVNSTAWCGIICDGHHVADDMVGLAIRARPVGDRMCLVSDAMPTVGGGSSFTLYGNTIKLVNGRLTSADGTLAGAHSTMATGLERLVSKVGISLETALRMAVSNPAKMMGIPSLASLVGRNARDVILLDGQCRMSGYLTDVALTAENSG